jgi:hypothetical protein
MFTIKAGFFWHINFKENVFELRKRYSCVSKFSKILVRFELIKQNHFKQIINQLIYYVWK